MFSQDPIQQKAQMEALSTNIDALTTSRSPKTYRSTTIPTQQALEAWWISLGNSLPIPPQQDVFWHDTSTLRSQHNTMQDYYLPIFPHPNANYDNASATPPARALGLFPIDKSHFVYTGTVENSGQTTVFRSVKMYADQSSTLLSESPILAYSATLNTGLFVNRTGASTYIVYTINVGTVVKTATNIDLGAPSATRPWVLHQKSTDGTILYLDTAANALKQRTSGGTITTLIANLATVNSGTLFRIRFDSTSGTILLFFVDMSSPYLLMNSTYSQGGNTAVYRVTAAGGSATALVTSQAFGAGFAESLSYNVAVSADSTQAYLGYLFRHTGAEVRLGVLYVPQTGLTSLNVNTRRKIDIATNVVLGTETFDYGDALSVLKDVAAEATAIRERDNVDILASDLYPLATIGTTKYHTGNHRTAQSRYFGVDSFSGLFTKLIDITRLPSGDGWFIKHWNTWGPGPTLSTAHLLGNSWTEGVLPDSYISDKIYAVTEYGDQRSDMHILRSGTLDAAADTITLDWSDLNMADYTSIEVSFDSGLSATDTIFIQVNGITTSTYYQVLFRQAAAVMTPSTNLPASAAANWSLPSIAQGATTGGRYTLLFQGMETAQPILATLDGFLTSGITTTLTSSVLGNLFNTGNGITTSIKIFTGGTGKFSVGTQYEVVGYRTKARYYRNGRYYGPYLV